MDPLLYNLNDRRWLYKTPYMTRPRADRIDKYTASRIERTFKILDSMHVLKAWFSELNKVLGYKTIEDLIRYMISNRLYGLSMIDRSFLWSETEQGHGFWHDANSVFNRKWDESETDIDFDFI